MSTDPNLSREELETLVALLEREKKEREKKERFWDFSLPVHWAIQKPGEPEPECPPGHNMICWVIVEPPQREEKERPVKFGEDFGSCARAPN
jgi:hypothetical protein